jgi:hypothetical protein
MSWAKSNTLPLTFRNAGGRLAESGELLTGETYTALPE